MSHFTQRLVGLILIVSVPVLAKTAVRRTHSAPATACAASQQWLSKLERPVANSQIVRGNAPNTRCPVLLELRDGSGTLLESRQVMVNPDDLSIVAGFDHPFTADNMIVAFTLRNRVKHFEKSVMVAQAGATTETDSTPTPKQQANGKNKGAKAAKSLTVAKAGKADPPPGDAPDKSDDASAAADPCSAGEAKQGIDIKGANSGNAHITGTSLIQEGSISFCVGGKPWKVASTDTPSNLVDSLDVTGGKFDGNLQEALATNENLVAIVKDADKMPQATSEVKVKPAIPADVNPEIETALVPGVSEIKVHATPTIANMGYEVRVFPCGPVEPGSVMVKWSTANRFWELTDDKGAATLSLDQPLYAGQRLSICQQIVDTTDASAAPTGEERPAIAMVTDPLDLGHVRYYFTSGVVMSQTNGFQQATGTNAGLFLGLNVDRSWLTLDQHGYRRYNINTYFDARLTSVSTQGAAMTPAASSSASSGAAAGTAATPATDTTPTTIDTFNQSRKAASLQAGLYVPWITTRWRRDKYSLFLAPLGKVGFVTLTEDPAGTEAAAGNTGTANAATGNSTEIQPVTGRFYTFYAAGARLGVYEHYRSRDSAPDLVSYVDIAKGRFGSFEAFRPLSQYENVLAQPGEFIRMRPWRWSFEGLLKVPYSPFVVGFNANIGGAVKAQRESGANGTILLPFVQPKDDLRFLFGARFDASKLLKAIPSLQ